MLSQFLLGLAFAVITAAHFQLNWPPSAGFVEPEEPNGPCGGQTPVFNTSTPQVQISQFAIAITSSHPVGEWMIRGTTDTQEPYNFTDLVPIVNTTGIGHFCLPDITAPDSFIGKSGLIQIVDNSPDGILYQCAPVNWVSGSNSTTGPTCTNATGFGAEFTSQQDFVSGEGSASASESATMSMSGMASTMSMSASGSATAAASSSSQAGAAMITGLSGLAGGVILVAGLAL